MAVLDQGFNSGNTASPTDGGREYLGREIVEQRVAHVFQQKSRRPPASRNRSRKSGCQSHLYQRRQTVNASIVLQPEVWLKIHLRVRALRHACEACESIRQPLRCSVRLLPHDDFRFSVFDGDNVVENHVRIARDRCLAWPATRCLQKRHRAKFFLRPLGSGDGTNEKTPKCLVHLGVPKVYGLQRKE